MFYLIQTIFIMKKILLVLFMAVALAACGTAYNDQLKQIELGMTQQQVVSLMGNKYSVANQKNNGDRTLEYVDKFKNHWFFSFVDGRLDKWYKETEN